MADETSASLQDIIKACKRGDDAAWRELLDRVSGVVFAACHRNRLSHEESLDIFGQVCYLLARNIGRVRSADGIFSYVATIARRQIFNRYRKDRGLDFVEIEQLDRLPDPAADSPDHVLEADRQRAVLLESLALLPSREFRLLHALFFDDSEPSYEEISAKLRIPIPSIGPTRARALKKLERILLRRGFKFDVFSTG